MANIFDVVIVEALKEAGGNQSKAARLPGSTKRIIQYKVEKFGIDVESFKPRA